MWDTFWDYSQEHDYLQINSNMIPPEQHIHNTANVQVQNKQLATQTTRSKKVRETIQGQRREI
jgi:hypothetical protein